MTIFLYILVLIFLLVFLGYIFYVYFLNRGAVYYPTTEKAAKIMLELSGAKKKDVLIDFGSGDGVVLFAAAKKGIKVIGYELDPLLVRQTRKKAKKLGLESLVEIRMKSMYKADFNEGTILYFYQFPKYLVRFEKLMNKKLEKKIKVVSNRYEFPGKKWMKRKNKVFLYEFGG